MDRFIINHLKKDELKYELLARGISTSDNQTVDDLRSCLRPLLKLEKSSKPLSYPDFETDFDNEKPLIETKLDELNDLIKTVQESHAKNKIDRIQSRLTHLLNRCSKIAITKDNSASRSELISRVLSATDTLDNISKNDPNSLFEATLSEIGNISDSSDESDNDPSSKTKSFPKHNAIYKWNLKFTGNDSDMSVYEFLDRVTEMRIARKVSEKELYSSAYDLFDGKARSWFVNNRGRFNNWKELSNLLISHHAMPDYKPRLFQNILERTQDQDEPIMDYLNCMYTMFRRYGNVSDEIQLDIIMRNLSPFYSSQLGSVHSLQELEQECIKLVTKKFRVDHYTPASQKKIDFVDKEFAKLAIQPSTSKSRSHYVSAVDSPSTSSTSDAVNQSFVNRQLTCWNCKQIGHLNRECPSPRTIHCFKCGCSGVTTRTCKNCNFSGNEPRRPR